MNKYELGDIVPSELGNQLGRAEVPVNFVAKPSKGSQTSLGLRVLLFYPNMRGHTMLPPAIALFSALLKERGFHVDLFDTTYYAVKGFSDNFDIGAWHTSLVLLAINLSFPTNVDTCPF